MGKKTHIRSATGCLHSNRDKRLKGTSKFKGQRQETSEKQKYLVLVLLWAMYFMYALVWASSIAGRERESVMTHGLVMSRRTLRQRGSLTVYLPRAEL